MGAGIWPGLRGAANVQGVNPLPGLAQRLFLGWRLRHLLLARPAGALYVVFMMQSPAGRLRYRYLMRDLVYQAMVN